MGGVTLEELIGAVDNLDEPKTTWNYQATLIGMTLAFGSLTSLCIGLRLWTRYRIIKSVGWDDHLVAFTMIAGAMGTVALCLAPGLGGMGRHWLNLTLKEQHRFFKLFYVGDAAFIMTTACIKASLLLQYLRIFTNGPVRWMCLATMTAVCIWGVAMSFAAWFPCFPVRTYWTWDTKDKVCYGYGSIYAFNHYLIFLTHSVVNMIFDLVILSLPVPLLFRKNTLPRTKIGVVSLLLVGLLANIFAALRLAETVEHRAFSYPTYDPSWYSAKLCILGMLEVNFACIGASVPVFWPVFRERFDAIFVTREINISVADRPSLDDLPLQRSESLYSHDGPGGSISSRRLWRGANSSRNGKGGDDSSEPGTPRLFDDIEKNNNKRGSNLDEHYKDTYVMDQVDPLRTKKKLLVKSTVTAEPKSRANNYMDDEDDFANNQRGAGPTKNGHERTGQNGSR